METSVYDLNILGEVDEKGQIIELYNKEAVENSIIVWLTSYQTDILRNPGRGGYLTRYLSRPMSDDNKQSMFDSLIDGFNQDFNIVLKLISLRIDADYENKIWNIYVEAYIPDIKDTIFVTTALRNLV